MEYSLAREAANKVDKTLRSNLNLNGSGIDIHEVVPVKFGGSPTNINNKTILE